MAYIVSTNFTVIGRDSSNTKIRITTQTRDVKRNIMSPPKINQIFSSHKSIVWLYLYKSQCHYLYLFDFYADLVDDMYMNYDCDKQNQTKQYQACRSLSPLVTVEVGRFAF